MVALVVAAQAGPAGEWRVQFTTPLGQRMVIMTLNQSGSKLTGHVTDEYGDARPVGFTFAAAEKGAGGFAFCECPNA